LLTLLETFVFPPTTRRGGGRIDPLRASAVTPAIAEPGSLKTEYPGRVCGRIGGSRRGCFDKTNPISALPMAGLRVANGVPSKAQCRASAN